MACEWFLWGRSARCPVYIPSPRGPSPPRAARHGSAENSPLRREEEESSTERTGPEGRASVRGCARSSGGKRTRPGQCGLQSDTGGQSDAECYTVIQGTEIVLQSDSWDRVLQSDTECCRVIKSDTRDRVLQSDTECCRVIQGTECCRLIQGTVLQSDKE